jgi:hypothetical protein
VGRRTIFSTATCEQAESPGGEEGAAMNRYIRLAVVAGLAFGFANAFAQEKTGTTPPPPPCEEKVSDPCRDIEPGAASPEPKQALEDPANVEKSAAHQRWLEEIWTSP